MILITGLDYSGTSALAGMLYYLGVDMGQIRLDAGPHEYCTFEDQQLAAAMVDCFRLDPRFEDQEEAAYHAWTTLLAYGEAHPARTQGVKNNGACQLGALLGQYRTALHVQRLLTTWRAEPARQAARLRRLGEATATLTAPLDAWCRAGYEVLAGDADACFDFDALLQSPAVVCDQLCRLCGLAPTAAQRQAAIQHIVSPPRPQFAGYLHRHARWEADLYSTLGMPTPFGQSIPREEEGMRR